jgi:hypothetical protein
VMPMPVGFDEIDDLTPDDNVSRVASRVGY